MSTSPSKDTSSNPQAAVNIPRHLLGMEHLSKEQILHHLDTARTFVEVSRRPVRKVPALKGKTVINLFCEPSTRTRTSFELAGKRLSADVVNISQAASSLTKGESLLDTCKTLEALHPDVVVLRHPASGAADFVASQVRFSVVNAGDGMHEHPTQALLDAFTIRERLGTLKGLKVAICGDILHSRVARSNAWLLRTMGSEVCFAGPRPLLPPHPIWPDVPMYDRLEPALEGADVVMVLRIQRERLKSASLSSLEEYARLFGLGPRQLLFAKPGALIMHPGPINRGVEIDPRVADGPQSVILDQVEAGLATRMATLYLLAGNHES